MCNFYIMYFTNATNGRSFYSCSGNNVPDLLRRIPSDSDIPPAPNPVLDDTAGDEPGHDLVQDPSSFRGNKGSNPSERRYDDRLYRQHGNSVGGGGSGRNGDGLVETKQKFRDGISSDDSRYPFASYGIQNDGSNYRSPPEDSAEWTPIGKDQPRRLESDYKRPEEEELAYEYAGVPDVGGADDRSVQDYMDEVAGQRSRYRHRYPVGTPDSSAAGYYRQREPLSQYGMGMLSQDADEDANRRRLYEEYDTGSRKVNPDMRGIMNLDPRVNSGEIQRSNKHGTSRSEQVSTVANGDKDHLPSAAESAINIVKDWPRLGDLVLGEVTGVSTDASGKVYVFHRGSRLWTPQSFDIHNRYRRVSEGPIPENTVVVISSDSGLLLGQWGSNLFSLPHGITVDHLNRVWLTDIALHQVIRFQLPNTLKPDLTLGVRFEPGADRFHLCQPTSVAVSSSGIFYIADGYCSSRIIMFSKDGNYLREWGERSRSVLADGFPAPSTFDVVHSLAVLQDHQMLCAADRENSRVQCFNLDNGQFIRQMHLPQPTGRLVAVSYCQSTGHLYAINGHDSYGRTDLRVFSFDPVTGLLLNSSRIIGEELYRPHALASSTDCRFLYMAHIEPNRVWKISTHEEHEMPTSLSTVNTSPVPSKATMVSGQKPALLGVQIDRSTLQTIGEDEGPSDDEESDFGVSLAIGGLLVVPVTTIAVITLLMRLRKSGKCRLLGHRCRNRRYSLSSLLSRRAGGSHDGFDRLRTDDNANHDELEHLRINSDSDIDDVTSSKHLKA